MAHHSFEESKSGTSQTTSAGPRSATGSYFVFVFGKLKYRRSVVLRYKHDPKAFLSAIALSIASQTEHPRKGQRHEGSFACQIFARLLAILNVSFAGAVRNRIILQRTSTALPSGQWHKLFSLQTITPTADGLLVHIQSHRAGLQCPARPAFWAFTTWRNQVCLLEHRQNEIIGCPEKREQ